MSPHDVSAIAERTGAARTRDLLAAGATRRDIQRACDSGSLIRLREGLYASDRWDPLLASAARHGGALACVSVLRRLKLWVLDDDAKVHVWIGHDGRAHPHDGCLCVTHRDRGQPEFGEVGLVRALVQALRCLGDEVFFAAFESALRAGWISAEDRERLRAMVPARSRWLVDFARDDADSGIESLVRLRLHRIGVAVDSQVVIAGVGRVDFVIARRLILEIDGKVNHDGESERHKDLVRDAAAAAQGYETLRFDYAQVVHDWPTVQAAVLGRLAALGA